MLTVTNNLPTHLVIPHGVAEGVSLKVAPKGQVQVERVTAALKDAEKRGHLTVLYPEQAGTTQAASAKAPAKKSSPNTPQSPAVAEPEETP